MKILVDVKDGSPGQTLGQIMVQRRLKTREIDRVFVLWIFGRLGGFGTPQGLGQARELDPINDAFAKNPRDL
ncbi:MAG: hypothetical protein LBR80_18225 [Deltaproteobacteria bacterium]|jgi:hypothetical protein|nr:hypothetical protein [Deltaproteobacteria bacterium]